MPLFEEQKRRMKLISPRYDCPLCGGLGLSGRYSSPFGYCICMEGRMTSEVETHHHTRTIGARNKLKEVPETKVRISIRIL